MSTQSSKPRKLLLVIAVLGVVLVGLMLASLLGETTTSADSPQKTASNPSQANAGDGSTENLEERLRQPVTYTAKADDMFDRQSQAIYLSNGQSALAPASASQISAAEKTGLFVKFMGMMNPLLQDKSKVISRADFDYLMRESDRLKNENYLMLHEYAIVQERLLRSQYSGTDLTAKIQAMQANVLQSREQLQAQHDPRKDPNYLIYASKEAQILQEANAMTKFPNGMTKEAYIVYRLEQIN